MSGTIVVVKAGKKQMEEAGYNVTTFNQFLNNHIVSAVLQTHDVKKTGLNAFLIFNNDIIEDNTDAVKTFKILQGTKIINVIAHFDQSIVNNAFKQLTADIVNATT